MDPETTHSSPTTGQPRRSAAADVDIGRGAATDDRFGGGWGPVLSGAVSAFMAFAILSSLWLALAASGADFISDNFGWWELLGALVAAPLGGYVAGRLQPSGDRMSAALRGFAAWGLLILVGLFVGVPSGAALFSGATELTLQGAADASASLGQFDEQLWATFAVFAGGALLASLAAAAGARTGHHPRVVDSSTDADGARHTTGDRVRTRS